MKPEPLKGKVLFKRTQNKPAVYDEESIRSAVEWLKKAYQDINADEVEPEFKIKLMMELIDEAFEDVK